MRCAICKRPLLVEIRFKDLFYYNFACRDCSRLLEIKNVMFPLDGGGVCEYSFFLLKDEYEVEIKYRGYPKIIEFLRRNRNCFCFVFDEESITDLWILKYLGKCQKVVIFSIKYIQLEDYFIDDMEEFL